MNSGIVVKGGGGYIIASGNITWDSGGVFPACGDPWRLGYKCEGRRGGEEGGGGQTICIELINCPILRCAIEGETIVLTIPYQQLGYNPPGRALALHLEPAQGGWAIGCRCVRDFRKIRENRSFM